MLKKSVAGLVLRHSSHELTKPNGERRDFANFIPM